MRLLSSFIGLIFCFLMYRYFISSSIDYELLQGILITSLPGTIFTICLSLLLGFSLTFINTKYWISGIVLLLVSGVVNYFGMHEVLTYPLIDISKIKITQSCLILIWLLGVTSPFTFFTSMANWTRSYIANLSKKQSTESRDSDVMWSRT